MTACHCPECGAVIGTLPEVHAEAVENLRLENERLVRVNRRLRREQDHIAERKPYLKRAAKVLAHWKEACAPKARELGGKRLFNCADRLMGGYTVDHLMRSVDGYALKPYVVNGRRTHDGPRDSWKADAELIFRDPWHVDQGLAIADEADNLRTLLSQNKSSEALRGVLRPSVSSSTTGHQSPSHFASAALQVAEKGRLVFPCRPKSKAPATRHGFRDAKKDPEAIMRAWSAEPNLNVAIPTGTRNGLVVLDVDTKDDVGWETYHRLEDMHGDWPDTLSVTTPSGGQHFYFQHPGVPIYNTASFPGPGVDIRGDGGYVLVPPSVNENGDAYVIDEEAPPAPMPSWLIKILVGYQAKLAKSLSGPNAAARYVELINNGASEGQRNDLTTRYVGHLFHHGFSTPEVYATVTMVNQRLKPPLKARELEAIVRSIGGRHARNGVTA